MPRILGSLGAKLLLTDIDSDVLDSSATRLRKDNIDVQDVSADVSDESQADAIVDACLEHFGRLDGIVNNAAIQSREWFADTNPSWNRKMVEVNVLGVIFCSRAAVRAMKARGGTIVNMTSGAQCGLSNQVVYSATKGAVASLTYSLAIELEDLNIRVNAVSPLAGTRMALFTPEFASAAAARNRNLPPPENNAAVVAYLLSDRSRPLTGQVVRVDGDGISLM